MGATGQLHALELESGKQLWSRDVLEDNDASVPEWGKSCSPLVVDGMVVVPQDEELRERCMHGHPIDGEAGDTSRAAIAELTKLCLQKD